jgi:hypothetical protein
MKRSFLPFRRYVGLWMQLALNSFDLLVFSLAVPRLNQAGVAQLVEQLICNHQVVGSSPITGSNINTIETIACEKQKAA